MDFGVLILEATHPAGHDGFPCDDGRRRGRTIGESRPEDNLWEKSKKRKAEGRKPAQPSIPEGILGFLPSDTDIARIRFAKLKLLKTRLFTTHTQGKNSTVPGKIWRRHF